MPHSYPALSPLQSIRALGLRHNPRARKNPSGLRVGFCYSANWLTQNDEKKRKGAILQLLSTGLVGWNYSYYICKTLRPVPGAGNIRYVGLVPLAPSLLGKPSLHTGSFLVPVLPVWLVPGLLRRETRWGSELHCFLLFALPTISLQLQGKKFLSSPLTCWCLLMLLWKLSSLLKIILYPWNSTWNVSVCSLVNQLVYLVASRLRETQQWEGKSERVMLL
jgi:hypothetical protein